MPAAKSRCNSQKSRQVAQIGRKRPKKGGQIWGAIAQTQAKILKFKPSRKICGRITDDPVHEPD